MAAYTPTNWQNYAAGGTPMSAANLNHLTDELELQAASLGIIHSLPNWANGAPPALTDATSLNEMENITSLVAAQLGLPYTKTVWQAGWTPGRNATNLNKLELAAQAARVEIDSAVTPTSKLPWKPPDFATNYAGYTVGHASNSNTSFIATPLTGQNLRLFIDSEITNGSKLYISGWRNVVLIGGAIHDTRTTVSNSNIALQVDKCDGIVHIEGLKIYGAGVVDAVETTSGPSDTHVGCDLRFQNVYIENNAISDVHADGIQINGGQTNWSGGVDSMKSYNLTIHANWQGIFLGTHDGSIRTFDFRNTNIVGIPPRTGATHQGCGWIFAITSRPSKIDAFGNGGYLDVGSVSNFWIDNEVGKWGAYTHMMSPDETGKDATGVVTANRRSTQGTDATGTFVNWVAGANEINGKMYVGRPPASLGGLPGNYTTPGAAFGSNDFVPITGNVGMSYVSPGYQ